MSIILGAIYRDGAFYPDTPPDLPEGAAVSLSVLATAVTPSRPLTGEALLARIRAIVGKFDPATDRPGVTSENVDRILYGGPDGAR